MSGRVLLFLSSESVTVVGFHFHVMSFIGRSLSLIFCVGVLDYTIGDSTITRKKLGTIMIRVTYVSVFLHVITSLRFSYPFASKVFCKCLNSACYGGSM